MALNDGSLKRANAGCNRWVVFHRNRFPIKEAAAVIELDLPRRRQLAKERSRSALESRLLARSPLRCCARDRTSRIATGIRGSSEIPLPPVQLLASPRHSSSDKKCVGPTRIERIALWPARQESTCHVLESEPDRMRSAASSLVERQELLSIFGFPERQFLAQRVFRQRAVLETALRENGHLHPRQLRDPARDDLAL